MTLLPNDPSMPVKDPDNLLMTRLVDCLIAQQPQLINLGVEKAPLGSSGSPRQLWVPSTTLCLKLDPLQSEKADRSAAICEEEEKWVFGEIQRC